MRKSLASSIITIGTLLIYFLVTIINPVSAASSKNDKNQTASGPLTSHPRLWLTSADLPRLQSWATPSNPMYAQGLHAALVDALAHVNDHWSWSFNGGTGTPDSGWQDDGSSNWIGDATEGYAEFFAFNSLIDPDPSNRTLYAQMARDMLMYILNQAVLGHADAPFRDPSFATYNRSNYWGEAYGLTVDWIYPTLTANDKKTIRSVFLIWANDELNAATTNEEHPQPVGVTNSPQLLADKSQLRWAANNYYTGHMRMLTLMSLSMDAADDQPVNPAQPPSQLGNTLGSYIANVTGAWLYQQYAMYEVPSVVAAAYGVPATGLGLANGGLSPEGFLYGASLGSLQEALLALHTAGYDQESLSGPQVRLVTSSYWDKFVNGIMESITPTPKVYTNYSYLGPLYQMMTYGDLEQFWIGQDFISAFGALGVYDELTNNAARLNNERWMSKNILEGGADQFYNRASNVWGNTYATNSIFYFMLFDPNAAEPTDPRPGLPTSFFSAGINRILSRTNWTTSANMFSYICNWATINHQYGDCNEFGFYRKGEWLTTERSGYMNDGISLTPDYHNILSIQNRVSTGASQPSNLQWFEFPSWQRGAQWSNGGSAGDPTALVSLGSSYTFAYGNATNLYNRPNPWTPSDNSTAVLHASRSIVWLKPDTIVIYDRATTQYSNLFKKFNLTLLAKPVISGNTATVTTSAGQKFYIQSLLPVGATIKTTAVENFQSVAELDPTRYRLTIQDTTNPANVRFLTVLQGADAGVTMKSSLVVTSDSGTAYKGVVVTGIAVMFPVYISTSFTSTSYVIPATVTKELITGLKPGAYYSVKLTSVSNGKRVTITVGGTTKADSGGVIAIGMQ